MCDVVTKGRALACNDQTGGVKHFDLAPFADYELSEWTIVAGVVTTLPAGLTEVFRFKVKSNVNKLDEAQTVNEDTGTSEIVGTFAVTLPKLGAPTQEQLKGVMGNNYAFVRDKNGNVHVQGIENGASGTASTKSTGGAGTDLSGYTFTITSKEKDYSPILSPAMVTALNALVSDEVIEP